MVLDGVPFPLQALKAACNEALSVIVARGGQVGPMWDRLLAAVVVTPDSHDDSAVSQYDISYQLNEIEVSLLLPAHTPAALSTVLLRLQTQPGSAYASTLPQQRCSVSP